MDTTKTGAPQSADGMKQKHGSTAVLALGAATALLAALLVLPGFMAAAFSRMDNEPWSLNGDLYSLQPVVLSSGQSFKFRVYYFLLEPSTFAAWHSPRIRRFYNWEYHAGGGLDCVFN
ncbi:MAG TPA: hypothetical protein VG733_04050 [Chthoniobacteraceae bacterium]|nr:hypothetical protein [Chthoniobacteraceae bacterium]